VRELEFERAAMKNEPMPNGLDIIDAAMYQSLATLYARFHAGAITREKAAAEKGKMLHSYEKQRTQRDYELSLYKHRAELFRQINNAADDYAKNRTLANADRMYEIIYGLTVKGADTIRADG